MTTPTYDAIIIGAGAGGGVAAGLLAEAGKRVLLLERGRQLSFAEVGRDHLRNQRLPQYGYNAGPDPVGNPRVAVSPEGRAVTVNPIEGGYQANAACVGSGTRVYGAQAWRFLPDDFRMASKYGVPPGSSLADWPITYDDLAPDYERAEWELGVSGDEATAGKNRPRHRPYPMPPLPLNTQGRALRAGAKALGVGDGARAASHQQRPQPGPRRLRPLPALRRLRLPDGCQERHAEHDDPARPGDGQLHPRNRGDGRAH